MNLGTTITLMLALMLALALGAVGGSTSRSQANLGDSSPAVRGHNLNHNETLVNDEATTKHADDWSLWLSSERSFDPSSVLIQLLSYRAGAGCSPWICGSNHNETLVSDEVPTQRTDDWSQWLSGDLALNPGSLFMQFSLYRVGAGCSPWVCGSNHNETLVRDLEFTPVGPSALECR